MFNLPFRLELKDKLRRPFEQRRECETILTDLLRRFRLG
jgi:hypothetical protein